MTGSSARTTGTAGVGAGVGCRTSGVGEKCNSTAPSAGNLGSVTKIYNSLLTVKIVIYKKKTSKEETFLFINKEHLLNLVLPLYLRDT